MTLEDGRVSPFAHLPHTRIRVPATADNQLPILADVKGAHVGAMADQQGFGVVIERFGGLPDVDDLVLSAGYDETLGKLSRGGHDGQCIYEFFALDLDGTVESWWLLRLELP